MSATLWVVLCTSVLGVFATLAILVLRPDADNAALITQVLGFLGTGSIALINTLKTDKVHNLLKKDDGGIK